MIRSIHFCIAETFRQQSGGVKNKTLQVPAYPRCRLFLLPSGHCSSDTHDTHKLIETSLWKCRVPQTNLGPLPLYEPFSVYLHSSAVISVGNLLSPSTAKPGPPLMRVFVIRYMFELLAWSHGRKVTMGNSLCQCTPCPMYVEGASVTSHERGVQPIVSFTTMSSFSNESCSFCSLQR